VASPFEGHYTEPLLGHLCPHLRGPLRELLLVRKSKTEGSTTCFSYLHYCFKRTPRLEHAIIQADEPALFTILLQIILIALPGSTELPCAQSQHPLLHRKAWE
jgi:hypothetical protein